MNHGGAIAALRDDSSRSRAEAPPKAEALLRGSQASKTYQPARFGSRRSSCAFRATTTVLADIRSAPTAGASRMPSEARAPAASGIATTLYPVAQARFWTIFR